MINTFMNLIDPYENWETYANLCKDDLYEDVIDESYELEARRILEEIRRRREERIGKGSIWLKEGF